MCNIFLSATGTYDLQYILSQQSLYEKGNCVKVACVTKTLHAKFFPFGEKSQVHMMTVKFQTPLTYTEALGGLYQEFNELWFKIMKLIVMMILLRERQKEVQSFPFTFQDSYFL